MHVKVGGDLRIIHVLSVTVTLQGCVCVAQQNDCCFQVLEQCLWVVLRLVS